MKYEAGEVIRAKANWTSSDGKLRINIGTKYKITHTFPCGGFSIIDNAGKDIFFEQHEIEFFFEEKTDPYDYAMDLL